ncbi:hypothetical protein FPOAC2_07037 [Fusarium poae]|jgi:hypothetical protein
MLNTIQFSREINLVKVGGFALETSLIVFTTPTSLTMISLGEAPNMTGGSRHHIRRLRNHHYAKNRLLQFQPSLCYVGAVDLPHQLVGKPGEVWGIPRGSDARKH